MASRSPSTRGRGSKSRSPGRGGRGSKSIYESSSPIRRSTRARRPSTRLNGTKFTIFLKTHDEFLLNKTFDFVQNGTLEPEKTIGDTAEELDGQENAFDMEADLNSKMANDVNVDHSERRITTMTLPIHDEFSKSDQGPNTCNIVNRIDTTLAIDSPITPTDSGCASDSDSYSILPSPVQNAEEISPKVRHASDKSDSILPSPIQHAEEISPKVRHASHKSDSILPSPTENAQENFPKIGQIQEGPKDFQRFNSLVRNSLHPSALEVQQMENGRLRLIIKDHIRIIQTRDNEIKQLKQELKELKVLRNMKNALEVKEWELNVKEQRLLVKEISDPGFTLPEILDLTDEEFSIVENFFANNDFDVDGPVVVDPDADTEQEVFECIDLD